MSEMTFREPLIFLDLGLYTCKWRVYLPVFTSGPFEDSACVCVSGPASEWDELTS